MNSHPFTSTCSRLIWLAMLMTAWITPTLQAVAPAKPTVTAVNFSRAGFSRALDGSIRRDSNGQPIVDTTGNSQSFLVRWDDKSVDEEGFVVNVSGKFKTSAIFGPNEREGLISGIAGLAATDVLKFSVTAWKMNGSKTESQTSSSFSFTIPPGTVNGALATPTSLIVSNVNDSTVKFQWTDNSTSELYNQIVFREVKVPEISFANFTFINFTSEGNVEQSLRSRLIPNTAYQFQLRSTRQSPTSPNIAVTDASFFSNTSTIQTLPLGAPTNLGGEIIRENLIQLTWDDNSTNETGYEIQYRTASPANFVRLGQVGENSRVANIPVDQGSQLEWRVLALYSYTPSGSTTQTTILSAPSNAVNLATTFPPASEVTAVTSPVANTVDVAWKDNSNSEYGFNVYCRVAGTTTFHFARAVPAGVTRVSVNSRAETFATDGIPNFTTLELNSSHEFIVRAVDAAETNFSVNSNTAAAVAKEGFTSKLNFSAQAGVSFNYLAVTSLGRSAWSVTGLPRGLTFDDITGTISGSPTETGIFQPVMTANFSSGTVAVATLNLRVLKADGAPSIITSFIDRTLGVGASLDVPLAQQYRTSSSEAAVRMTTTKGDIDILLYPSLAPKAVANFMAYVNAGNYDGIIFHRLLGNFVLQAGSLKTLREPSTFTSVPNRPLTENEPGLVNSEWTVAAAKIGARSSLYTRAGTLATIDRGNPNPPENHGYEGNPNSASTDFFVNLANNSSNLDNQNSGFTVFGRISTPSQAVVNSIKTLPTGNYTNGNTTENYNVALDKRIIVNGNLQNFTDIPMDTNGTAPANMDISMTVKITKIAPIPPVTYTSSVSLSPPGIVSAIVTGSTVRLRGLKAGSAMVTITARNVDNLATQSTFNVTVAPGHRAVAITKQPVLQNVVAGTTRMLSVTATGTAPISYTWRKDSNVISGESGPTLTLSDVQMTNVGLYDVLVGNATTSILSNRVRVDIISLPLITPALVPMLVEVGNPLVMQTRVTGSPIPTITWRRGTTILKSAITNGVQPDGSVAAKLNIPAAKLTEAGAYSISVSNSAGAVPATGVSVMVVDKNISYKVVRPNTPLILVAPFSGIATSYRWQRDGIDIPLETPRFSGIETAKLSISKTELTNTAGIITSDSGNYTCRITLASGLGSTVTGPINLAVVNRPSMPTELKGNFALPNGFIGIEYTAALPYSDLLSYKPTSFTFRGLPPGMKFNTLTGMLSGRPTKAGVFPFSANANNISGASYPTSTGQLIISPIPAANVGTFTAVIRANTVLNNDKGGRLDLSILDTGSYSAKIILGKTTLSAAGSMSPGTGLFDASTVTYQSRISIPRKGLSTLNLIFEVDANGGYVTGLLNDGKNTTNISGLRQFWNSRWNPCFFRDRSFNLGLNLSTADLNTTTVPQGTGYLNMLTYSNGTAKIAGRLADGTTMTGSSLIGPQGETLFFQMLYNNTGSVLSTFEINSTSTTSSSFLRVSGQTRWVKDIQVATARDYQGGIPETFLNVLGTDYYKPGTGAIVMGALNVPALPARILPALQEPATIANTNVQMAYTPGGPTPFETSPDVAFRLSTTHTVNYPVGMPNVPTFRVDSRTGAYSGSFTLADARKVSFNGLIIPAMPHTPATTNSSNVIVTAEIPGTSAVGAGYFLMPELLPDLKTSKIYSGKAMLTTSAIQITNQPSPAVQAVNPGSSVVFSVTVATPPPAAPAATLTYRWRKDGNTIPGAIGPSLLISGVSESSQAVYDCVISTTASTITSNQAVLNVNDSVTNVSAARSPSDASITAGNAVTFTATAQGTELTYQWKKGVDDIIGATAATYVISSPVAGDSGSYQVVVKNAVITAGITSNVVALTVTGP